MAEAMADRIERVAKLIDTEGISKTATESELDPVHTLNFLKFFTASNLEDK
jgi:hypothetical protein